MQGRGIKARQAATFVWGKSVDRKMDLRAGRLPQPQQHHPTPPAPSTTSTTGATSSNNPFNGTETFRTNEPNKFITFKDVYDYLSLDFFTGLGGVGDPAAGSANEADLLFGLANYTLDGAASGSILTLNQSTTIFQNTSSSNNAWNTTLWLANGSFWAAATTASISVANSTSTLSNGNELVDVVGEGEAERDIGNIIVTAATSIILGLMILITVIGELTNYRGCPGWDIL